MLLVFKWKHILVSTAECKLIDINKSIQIYAICYVLGGEAHTDGKYENVFWNQYKDSFNILPKFVYLSLVLIVARVQRRNLKFY